MNQAQAKTVPRALPGVTTVDRGEQPADQATQVLQARFDDVLARIDAQDAAYGRVEVILAGFAVIITILVLYFTVRVERSAIQASVAAAKDDLKSSRDEIENCVQAAKDAAERSKEILLEIEGHKQVAASDVRIIRRNRDSSFPQNTKKSS